MPLGIIQDRHLEHVPGTATLDDLDPIAALQEQADGRELKRSRNGTILVPQPSDDPNGMASRLYVRASGYTPCAYCLRQYQQTRSTIPSGVAT
jgi:hypothetical protein